MSRQRGYSYLAVLFLVALTAAGLAALGQAWSTMAQREKERELEFRGGEIARAMRSYFLATPKPPGQYPASLDELLEDRRGPAVRRHLRRLYADPFTGLADWELLPEPGQAGRYSGLHSRSTQPLLRAATPDGTLTPTAADRVFTALATQALPPAEAASRPASTPSAATH